MLSPSQNNLRELLAMVIIQVWQLLIVDWHIFSFIHLGCSKTKLYGISFRLDNHIRFCDIKLKNSTISSQLQASSPNAANISQSQLCYPL